MRGEDVPGRSEYSEDEEEENLQTDGQGGEEEERDAAREVE